MSSLKYEIETWAAALKAYDSEDWDTALDLFSKIADNSKILTNIGLIYAALGEHEAAIEKLNEATELDNYLAIAYFQAGVSHFLLGQFEIALQQFDEAFQFLRGNESINYEQIGLKYQLHCCAVLFNQGVTLLNLGDREGGMQALREAAANKAVPDHDVVDEAIQEGGDGYTVFSIPVGVLYRPNEKKVANMATRDYMGKAKLISTTAEAAKEFAPAARVQALRKASLEETLQVPGPGLGRSRSAAPAVLRDTDGPPRASPLGRSASARPIMSTAPIKPLAVQRSASVRRPEPMDPPAGPMRRPTLKINSDVERPPTPPETLTPPRVSQQRPAPPMSKYGDSGLTDIYDDYLESNNGGPLGRKLSVKAPVPARLGRSNTVTEPPVRQSAFSRADSYGGERLGSFGFEMKRLRVKVHFRDEIRGMVVAPNLTFSEFLEQICSKFNYELGGLRLKFADEDGAKVSLRDEGDWEMALETVRDYGMSSGASSAGSVKPGEGRLTLWCEEDYP